MRNIGEKKLIGGKRGEETKGEVLPVSLQKEDEEKNEEE